VKRSTTGSAPLPAAKLEYAREDAQAFRLMLEQELQRIYAQIGELLADMEAPTP
jgi:hypothetical protein